MSSKSRGFIAGLLSLADVEIDGDRDGDIRVLDGRFYPGMLSGGSPALGESYIDGWGAFGGYASEKNGVTGGCRSLR